MKALRVSVEWGFGKIVSLFQYLNHEENLRLFLQPVHTAWPSLPPTPAPPHPLTTPSFLRLLWQVGLYFPVANILTNCHTCLYHSQTGLYFGLDPPSLEDYLNGEILPAF